MLCLASDETDADAPMQPSVSYLQKPARGTDMQGARGLECANDSRKNSFVRQWGTGWGFPIVPTRSERARSKKHESTKAGFMDASLWVK